MDQLGVSTVVEMLTTFENQHGERFAPCEKLKAMAEKREGFYSNALA